MRGAIRLCAAALVLTCGAPALASGLIVFGAKAEGEGLDGFEKVIDYNSGHERLSAMQGVGATEEGFDGGAWVYSNGVLNSIDLPSEARDRAAERWLGQNIGRLTVPAGKTRLAIARPQQSPITIDFAPGSRRPSRATIDSSHGPVVVTYSDWRRVGSAYYPFTTERLSDTGERTAFYARSIRPLARVDRVLLRRPAVAPTPPLAGGVVAVPFRTHERSTHIFVDATVDGHSGEFVFDTGGANILTSDAVEAFGLPTSGGINISGVGEGSAKGGFAFIKHVDLGGVPLTDQSFVVIPPIFPKVNGKPSPTVGLLGYEHFGHYITTIDYSSHRMEFRDRVPTGQKGVRLPFASDGHIPFVQATVNGRLGWFGLDTGDSSGVTIFPAFAALAGIKPTDAPASSGGGVGGGVKQARGHLDHFSFGGVGFDNLPVRFALNDKGAFASRFIAGNLGGQILSCFRITIDNGRHQLWLEPTPNVPTCQLNAIAKPAK